MFFNRRIARQTIITASTDHLYDFANPQLAIKDSVYQFNSIPHLDVATRRSSEKGTLSMFTNIHCVLEQFNLSLKEASFWKHFQRTFSSNKRLQTKIVSSLISKRFFCQLRRFDNPKSNDWKRY